MKDPKNIAEQVEKMLSDDSLRARLIKNAEKMVKEKYDWDIIANDMKNKVFLRTI